MLIAGNHWTEILQKTHVTKTPSTKCLKPIPTVPVAVLTHKRKQTIPSPERKDEPRIPLNIPLTVGITVPVLGVECNMLPPVPAVIIVGSTDDETITFEFPLCRMPGVGIIVASGTVAFTNCDC